MAPRTAAIEMAVVTLIDGIPGLDVDLVIVKFVLGIGQPIIRLTGNSAAVLIVPTIMSATAATGGYGRWRVLAIFRGVAAAAISWGGRGVFRPGMTWPRPR